jgi:hypothetical protein
MFDGFASKFETTDAQKRQTECVPQQCFAFSLP